MSLVDSIHLGSSLSLRSFIRFGSGVSLLGTVHGKQAIRIGQGASVLDFLQLGSSLALRHLGRLGSAVAVMDFLHLGSSVSLRSFARVGTLQSSICSSRGKRHGSRSTHLHFIK